MSESWPDPESESFSELVFGLLPILRESHSTLPLLGDWKALFAEADSATRPLVKRFATAQGAGWLLLGQLIDRLGSASSHTHCLDLANALAAQLRPPKGTGQEAARMLCDVASLLANADRPREAFELRKRATHFAAAEAGLDSPAALLLATKLHVGLSRQDIPDPERALVVGTIFVLTGRTAEGRLLLQGIWDRRARGPDEAVFFAGMTLALFALEQDVASALSTLGEIVPLLNRLPRFFTEKHAGATALILSNVQPAAALSVLRTHGSTAKGENSHAAAVAYWRLGLRDLAITELRSGLDAVDRTRRYWQLLTLVSYQLSMRKLDDDIHQHVRELAAIRRRRVAALGPQLSKSAMQSLAKPLRPLGFAAGAWLQEQGAGERSEAQLISRWTELVAEESWALQSMLIDHLAGKFSQLDSEMRAFESGLGSSSPLEAEARRHRRYLTMDPPWSNAGEIRSWTAATGPVLRDGEAAVEFIRAHMGCDDGDHLAAFVTRGDREPKLIDLGPLGALADEVKRLQRSIRWAVLGLNGRRPTEVLRSLGNSIWRPIQASLSGVDVVYCSTGEEALSSLPLEALIVGDSHLLESGPRIRYLASSRELFYRRATGYDWSTSHKSSDRRALLLGDPAFTEGGTTDGRLLRADGRLFRRLPASRRLIDQACLALGQLGLEPKVLVGESASRSALLSSAEGAEVLMIVTHGIAMNRQIREGDFQLQMASNDPLGTVLLALADGSDGSNGQVSGAEIARLDLRSTALAILAACSSGSGEVLGYGLPPQSFDFAFHLSGVRYRIAARHDVLELPTLELMAAFWAELQTGRSIPDAFHEAQLALLSSDPHPAVWASFRLSGL